jgi:hypothetical protein
METLIINRKRYDFSEKIETEIFDIINQDLVDTIDFLSDDNNIVFKIEDSFVGMSKYFYPFEPRNIIYDCKNRNFKRFQETFSKNDIEYINMESLGLILEPPNMETGVLVLKEKLENLLNNNAKIIKLVETDKGTEKIITNIVSQAVLNGSSRYGFQSALHCQGNYFGKVFNVVDLQIYTSSPVSPSLDTKKWIQRLMEIGILDEIQIFCSGKNKDDEIDCILDQLQTLDFYDQIPEKVIEEFIYLIVK